MLQGCTPHPYQLKNIAKTDIDMVVDSHRNEVFHLLKSLTVKLYKRNPRELAKAPDETIQSRLQLLFGNWPIQTFPELDSRQNADALHLCFTPGFSGDRVFALMSGLTGMIQNAYNNRPEQFMLDSLDEQKLYNSARNIEIVIWRLSNRHQGNGEPFLYTNHLDEDDPNLSFERLFGKVIALQDMMAKIIADKGNRAINMVVHNVASAVLLPVGL